MQKMKHKELPNQTNILVSLMKKYSLIYEEVRDIQVSLKH